MAQFNNQPDPRPSSSPQRSSEEIHPQEVSDIEFDLFQKIIGLELVQEVRRFGCISLFESAHVHLKPYYGDRDFTLEWNRPEKLAELTNVLFQRLDLVRGTHSSDLKWLETLGVSEERIRTLKSVAESTIYPGLRIVSQVAREFSELTFVESGLSAEASRTQIAFAYLAKCWRDRFTDRFGFQGFIRDLAANLKNFQVTILEEALSAMESLYDCPLLSLLTEDQRPLTENEYLAVKKLVEKTRGKRPADTEFINIAAELAARAIYSERANF